MNRRVLIVSPHFAPINAPDGQRVRMSLRYFREFGWEPVVLAVDANYVEATVDPLLLESIPTDVPVHRCRALPVRWTRWLGIGTLGLRAWPFLRQAGDRLLREQRFDLVYFSTTQWITLTLGPRWRRLHGVPFIVDLQDPWVSDYYDRPGAPRPPGGWKYRFAQWQAKRLEAPTFRAAAGFVSVSPVYLENLRTRYAWFATRPAAVVPFGADEEDLAIARRSVAKPAFTRAPGKLHVLYVGAVGPIMRPALELLFAGVRTLQTTAPTLAMRLRLHFIGTNYAPGRRAVAYVQHLANSTGMGSLVEEIPTRIGYFHALKTMLEADALLLLGSDDSGYSPSKIAATGLARRPTLALIPGGGALEKTLETAAFAVLARYSPSWEVETVSDFFTNLAAGRVATADMSDRVFADCYSARARTREQCAIFDRAVRTGHGSTRGQGQRGGPRSH